VSPFLHHINELGLQFGYGLIRDPESVPFNFFYTSNVSLPRGLLLEAGLFDTTFPHAAWEDIEVAYRLTQQGMKILYRPEAVARHFHDVTLASFRRRQEKSGEAAAIFFEKHPELGDFLGVPQALTFSKPAGSRPKPRGPRLDSDRTSAVGRSEPGDSEDDRRLAAMTECPFRRSAPGAAGTERRGHPSPNAGFGAGDAKSRSGPRFAFVFSGGTCP
jgi:hypothetical protein